MKSTPIPRVGTTWLCLSGLLAAGSGASAAVITWGTAQDTTVVASISNTGTPVFAKNEGTATSNVVVNGVTFVPSNSLGSTASGLLNGANTFNNDMKSLLDTVSFGATPSIDLAPLGTYILGTIYQIQVFFTDQRTTGGANDKTITFGSSGVGGNTVTLEADPNNDISAPWGQYAIGTFVHDGTAPIMTLSPSAGNPNLTAWQVRAIPEPTTAMSLLGSMGALLLLRRRS